MDRRGPGLLLLPLLVVTALTVAALVRSIAGLVDLAGRYLSTHGIHVPVRAIGYGLLTMLAVAAALTALAGGALLLRRRRLGRLEHAERLARLDARDAKLQDAVSKWRDDLGNRLSYPAIEDVSDPVTRAYYEAAAEMIDRRPTPTAIKRRVDLGLYEAALGRAEIAWQAAVANAERLGRSKLPQDTRDRLDRAEKLLALIRDDRSPAPERAAALHTLRALIRDLRLPGADKIMAAIERDKTLRPALAPQGEAPAPAPAL
jgi:hypothetical protein